LGASATTELRLRSSYGVRSTAPACVTVYDILYREALIWSWLLRDSRYL